MILESGEILQSHDGYDVCTWLSGPTVYYQNRAYFVSARKQERDVYMYDFDKRALSIAKANVF